VKLNHNLWSFYKTKEVTIQNQETDHFPSSACIMGLINEMLISLNILYDPFEDSTDAFDANDILNKRYYP
jgi:hypothetical protein